MKKAVHGHEVVRMMTASGESYTCDLLVSTIIEKFDQDTRFYTCSAENMAAGELVDFHESRNKFIEKGAGFSTDPDRICDH